MSALRAVVLAALMSVGCASVRVDSRNGAPSPSSDTDVAIAALSAELALPAGAFDGLLVQYDAARHWSDPRVAGIVIAGLTTSPYYVWILHDDVRRDACSNALVHELIHVHLWRTSSRLDGDGAHATPGAWGPAGIEGRVVARVCATLGRWHGDGRKDASTLP